MNRIAAIVLAGLMFLQIGAAYAEEPDNMEPKQPIRLTKNRETFRTAGPVLENAENAAEREENDKMKCAELCQLPRT